MADLLFQLEGQTLPISDKRDFGGFYRLYCRPDPHARARATALREAYLRYAMALGLGGISFKELAAAMVLRGHEHFMSNGSIYRGVRLLNVPEVPLDPGPPPPPPLPIDALDAQIERVAAELRLLRRLVRQQAHEQDGGA